MPTTEQQNPPIPQQPPDTLPADFSGWDDQPKAQASPQTPPTVPDTLPANFSGWDQPKPAAAPLRPGEREAMAAQLQHWGITTRHDPATMSDDQFKSEFDQIKTRMDAQGKTASFQGPSQFAGPLGEWLRKNVSEPIEKVWRGSEENPGPMVAYNLPYQLKQLREGSQKYVAPTLEAVLHDPAALGDPTKIGDLALEATKFATATEEDRNAWTQKLASQHGWLGKIQAAYLHSARSAAVGGANFISDPVNWGFMAVGGGLAKAAPMVSFATNAIFQGLMAKGLWDTSITAGNQLAKGDTYGFFDTIGTVPMQAYFVSHGMHDAGEQIRSIRLVHNLDVTAQSGFEKPFSELNPQERYQVSQSVLKTLSSPKYVELSKDILAAEGAKDARKVGEAYQRLQAGEDPGIRDDLQERANVLLQYQRARGLDTTPANAPSQHLASLYTALSEGALSRKIDTESARTIQEHEGGLQPPPVSDVEAAGTNQAGNLMAEQRRTQVDRAVQDMIAGKTPNFYDEEVQARVERSIERDRQSLDARLKLENEKSESQSGITQAKAEADAAREKAAGQGMTAPPTVDEVARLRERIEQEAEDQAHGNFRDLGRRQGGPEGQPQLAQPLPAFQSPTVPILEGSPLTPEQRFAEAESEAWKLVNEGRASDALQLLALYDEYLQEQPAARAERFKEQTDEEMKRLGDAALAEEERLTKERPFIDLGRKQGEPEEAPRIINPELERATPPNLQSPDTEPALVPPLPVAEETPTPGKKVTFETPGTIATLPHVAGFAGGEVGGTAARSMQGIPIAWGNRGTVVTPGNRRVEFQYATVPAEAVVTSFDSEFNPNPDYPKPAWQPRDVSRVASKDRLLSLMSPGDGQLDFSRMADNPNAGDGAPIVALVEQPDHTVKVVSITRQHGTIATETLYKRDSPIASQYKQDLLNSASKFGLADANIDHPMLVRMLKTPLSDSQIADFAQEANVATTARMSATETAKLDAQKLTPEVLGLLRPTEDGSINNVANADFVRAFVNSVAAPSERGALMTKEGTPSNDGLTRIRNALFARAYPGSGPILEMVMESPDVNIRNVKNAMDAAAPKFAVMQDMTDRGVLYDLGITEDIGDAAKKLSELRKNGRSVEDYLGQINLPGTTDMSDAARELLRAIHEKGRSVKGLTQILSDYADAVISRARKDQGTMFVGEGPVVTKEGILRTVTANNSSLDFGDEGPAPTPEPAPASQKLTPPIVSASLEYPVNKDIQPSAADVQRHQEMLQGLNKNKIAREAVAARRDEKGLVSDYEKIREGGMKAVLEIYSEDELADMLGTENNTEERMSSPELQQYIAENGNEIVRGMLGNLQRGISETRARGRAAVAMGGKSGEKLEPPMEVEAAPPVSRKVADLGATKQMTGAEKEDAIRREIQQDKELLGKNPTAEERAVLEQRIAENQKDLDAVKGPPAEQFKAAKKGGMAMVVVGPDGREIVAQQFSKEFTKKNRDSLVGKVGSSAEPRMLVDETGKVLAQSPMWDTRQNSRMSVEQIRALPDSDLKTQMDAARAGMQNAQPGSPMHSDFAGFASRLEDDLKRRSDLEAQPKGFGSRNTIVTEEEKDEIIKRLASGTQLSAGLPIDDIAKLGMYYFEAGFREAAAWAEQMVKVLGEKVRPYLDDAWKMMPAVGRQAADQKLATADDATREKINKQMDILKQAELEAKAKMPPTSRVIGRGLPYALQSIEKLSSSGDTASPENGTWRIVVQDLQGRPFGSMDFFAPKDFTNEQAVAEGAKIIGQNSDLPPDRIFDELYGGSNANTSGPVGASNDEGVQNQGRGATPPPLDEASKSEIQPTKPTVAPGDGTGTAPRRSPVAIAVDAPTRVRGQWVVDGDKWRVELKKNGLPESAPGPTVTLSPDVDKMLIYRPQKPIVEMALSELEHGSGAFIIAAGTGTGKTYVGSAIIKETLDRNPGKQYISVLTKNQELVRSFKNVLAEHGIEGMEFPAGVSAPPEPGVYVTTYATLRNRPGMENFPWNLSVYDESSEMRNWQSSQQGAKGRIMGRSSEKNLYLSATPFSNAIELGYLDSLGLWGKQGFETFARQFGVHVDRQTGLLAGGNAPLKLDALRKQLIQRGQFVNLDPDLSGQRFAVSVVPLDESHWQGLKDADDVFQKAERFFVQRNQTEMVAATRAARTNYLKAYLERSRLNPLLELMKKGDAAGYKIGVYSETMSPRDEPYNFLKPVDDAMGGQLSKSLPPLPGIFEALQREFGDQIANLSGSGDKTQEIEDFNSGAKKHIFASYAKGGFGVSLHDQVGDAPRMAIYIGPPWSGMMFQQGLGRFSRYGSKSDVFSVILASDSKAEYTTVVQRVLARLDSMKALVSGVDKESQTIKSMRSIEDAASYSLGSEDPDLLKDIAQRVDTTGISNYKDIQIPNADGMKNRGMNVERRDLKAPPGAQVGRTLYSGFDPIAAAKAVADLARDAARAVTKINTKIKAAFGRGNEGFEPPPDPGDPDQTAIDMTVGTPSARRLSTEAFEDAEPGTKENFTSTVDALAQNAANGVTGDPTPVVVSTWRNAVDDLREAKARTGNAGSNIRDFLIDNVRMAIARRGGDIGMVIGGPLGGPGGGMIPEYQIQKGNIPGPWMLRAQDIKMNYKLSNAEWSNLSDTVEGVARPINDRVAAAVPELRKVWADVAQASRDANVTMEIRDPRTGQMRYSLSTPVDDPNYMPHKYPPEIFKPGPRRDRIVQQIMQRDGLNLNDAERKLDSLKRDVPLAGNLERPREMNLPGYRTDFNATLEALEDAGEVIARTNVFGQRREKVSALISMVPEAADRKFISDSLDLLLKNQPFEAGPRDLVHVASTYTIVSKMLTSTISMASHTLKPALESSMKDYFHGFARTTILFPKAERIAMDAGAILQHTHDDWNREIGLQRPGLATRFLTLTGARWLDKFGRVLAANVAQIHMDKSLLPDLIKNPGDMQARRLLQEHYYVPEEMIDKAIEDRAWTREALARGAKSIVDRTMFTYDPTETPGAFRAKPEDFHGQTAAAFLRTSLLLKSYMWKNTYFFKDALINEARKGNFKPWVPFLTLFPAVGTALMALRTASRGDKKQLNDLLDTDSYTPTKIVKVAAEGIAFQAAASSLSAMVEAANRHNLTGWAVGPAIGDALNIGQTGISTFEDLIGGSPSKTVPNRFQWAKERGQELLRQTIPALHPFIPPPPKHPPIREGGGEQLNEPY